MKFFKALSLDTNFPYVISFIGGGGKTTAMFRLASELKILGKRVLVTTTTAIFKPDHDRYDTLRVISGSRRPQVIPPVEDTGSVTVFGSGYRLKKDKLDGLAEAEINEVANAKSFDVVLVEADGSRRLPVKSPADHEPVVPETTDICIAVTGFDCWGRPADDKTVHRLEDFLHVTGAAEGDLIGKGMFVPLADSPLGMFKGSPSKAKRVWLINKVDTGAQLEAAVKLGSSVLKESAVPDMVLVASARQDEPVLKVLNRS